MSTDYGRHRSATHPLARAEGSRGVRAAWVTLPAEGGLPPVSAAEVARAGDRLDQGALDVVLLQATTARLGQLVRRHPHPLSVGQRPLAKVMGAELARLGAELARLGATLMRRATEDQR